MLSLQSAQQYVTWIAINGFAHVFTFVHAYMGTWGIQNIVWGGLSARV